MAGEQDVSADDVSADDDSVADDYSASRTALSYNGPQTD